MGRAARLPPRALRARLNTTCPPPRLPSAGAAHARLNSTAVPITVAYGDGIGPEIMESTMAILNAAGAKLAPQVRGGRANPTLRRRRSHRAALRPHPPLTPLPPFFAPPAGH